MEYTNGSIESQKRYRQQNPINKKYFCWKFFDVIAFPSWHKANLKGYHKIQLTGTWKICKTCPARIVERAHVSIVSGIFNPFGTVRSR